MVQQVVITRTDEVQRYRQACAAAGLPEGQYNAFIDRGYIAWPELLPFHKAARDADKPGGPEDIFLGGTRGPGKSHAVLAQVGLDDCQRAPGVKWLYLRKVMKTAAEGFDDLVRKVFTYTPHTYVESSSRVEFPNGSRILIGGYNSPADIDKYLGIEYDGIVIEEAAQFAEDRRDKIKGSCRSTIPGWRERRYYTGNPLGVGIPWIKRDFILPYRTRQESRTRFIPCHWRMNKLLSDVYITYLGSLRGQLGKAWRDGDWDAFEGMAFPHWSEEIHVVDPFPLDPGWVKWRAIDYGFTAPFCCLWFAQHSLFDRIFVYREVYADNKTTVEQARLVLDSTPPGENIAFTYADPAMWSKENRQGQVYTVEEEYRGAGLLLTKADNDRFNGKAKIDNALSVSADGLPGLQIFRTCYNLIRTLPELPLDPVKTWDVDTKAEDHPYDTLRYGYTNKRAATPRPAATRQPETAVIQAAKWL